jgi:hypothetical protein
MRKDKEEENPHIHAGAHYGGPNCCGSRQNEGASDVEEEVVVELQGLACPVIPDSHYLSADSELLQVDLLLSHSSSSQGARDLAAGRKTV